MSGTPGNANRTLPVLSVMMRQAELWDLRPQGSNPCRDMRRYRTTSRERFLSLDELKRLGFVLGHADDRQAAAAIRLLLFTGARSSKNTGLRWNWIRGARAVLPDSKTGPKAVQLPPPARAVLNGLPLADVADAVGSVASKFVDGLVERHQQGERRARACPVSDWADRLSRVRLPRVPPLFRACSESADSARPSGPDRRYPATSVQCCARENRHSAHASTRTSY